MISTTPPERLVDQENRPYFLWDMDLDVDEFRARLRDADAATRAYFLGKLMRQAKPDDVFLFVTRDAVLREWEAVQPHLGTTRPFWTWLVSLWKRQDDEQR